MDWRPARAGLLCLCDDYLIDTQDAVIVDVEATRAIRQAAVGAARTMIDRTRERFGLHPKRLAGDSAYGAAPMLAWLVKERGIAPHIPVFDKSKREDGTLSRADFTWDAERDLYVCPRGKTLKTTAKSMTAAHCFTGPASTTARPVFLNRGAVRRPRIARSRATSMRTPATSPEPSTTRRPSTSRAASASGSRCCSPTSSAS